jgi:hypothetical protein
MRTAVEGCVDLPERALALCIRVDSTAYLLDG